MNDKYLRHIDYLIDIGSDVLATMRVKSTPAQVITGQDVMGEPYIQKRIPATNSEYVDENKYLAWVTDVIAYLQNHFSKSALTYVDSIKIEQAKNQWKTNGQRAKAIFEIVNAFRDKVKTEMVIPDDAIQVSDYLPNLHIIFDKFHDIVRELRTRYKNRTTLSVNDEYDVQDLLRALLRLYFNDVRSEEWTPSYAGASARMDFLLKTERVVIEAKRIRKTLTTKKLGNELIEDIARYKTHPDCDKLICFVYDPEGLLGNPEGIMNDLNTHNVGFVEVVIKP